VPSDNVGCLKPNPWGFYDILGNVWERIYGSNEPYPAYSETEVTENPVTDDRSSDLYGVQRGGAYTGGADQQKSGLRSTLTKGDFIVNDYAHQNSGFRLAKQIAAGAHVTPVTNATASVSGVAVDFSSAAVRKILVTNEILSVAWSTGSAWPAGGGAQEAELREVTCAYVTAGDPSTWSEGAAKTLMTASSGEGTCGWIPTLQGAYKLVWLIDGSRCGEACFDCTETQGVRGGIPIDEAVVTVPPQVLVATGEPLMPTGVTVRLDGVLLREGIDYSLRGSGNLAPGTATVTAYGSGGYAGSSSSSFAILPSTATDLAQGAGAAVEPGDFTTNAWRTVRNRSQLRRFTYSPTNFTGCAGTTAASRAVVSVAPMTPGAEDDLTTWTVREGERTTLADQTEEGSVRWKASCGVWQARFDIVTGATTNHTETAIFDLRRFTSGLVLRLR